MLTEGPPRLLTEKDVLVGLLATAVEKAHKQNPNASGVILYGSRTHTGFAQPGSDVDVVLVLKQPSIPAQWAITREMSSALVPFPVRIHTSGFGVLTVREVRRAKVSEETQKRLRQRFPYLDHDSQMILIDPALEQEIRSVLGLEGKKWSREQDHQWHL